jgi:protein MpaA
MLPDNLIHTKEKYDKIGKTDITLKHSKNQAVFRHLHINRATEIAKSAIKSFFGIIVRIKVKIYIVLQIFWLHRKFIAVITTGSLVALIIIGIGIYTFIPQSINYSFASHKNCIDNPAIFPNVFMSSAKGAFTLYRVADISIGKTPIFSYKLCADLNSVPLSRTTYVSHQQLSIGDIHIGKLIRITTASYPVATNVSLTNKAIPLSDPFVFKLNLVDNTFNYDVISNGQTSTCLQQITKLTCSITPLRFMYASNYQISLVRVFNKKIAGVALSKSIQTVTATAITQSSITPGAVVYDKPQVITLQADKLLTGLQAISLTAKNVYGTTTSILVSSSFNGETVTVNIADPLPRQASFDLHISNLSAIDQSTLQQPYDLMFTTSGGPQVTGINLPSYGVASGKVIVVTFSQDLLASQAASSFASLIVNGVIQPASYSLNGNQLSIEPTENYPVCATILIQLNDQAQNDYGVSGNSAWSFTTRSHCYTIFSIGTSVDGRPITAYQFGSGSSMVLYIGAMEGDEQNSSELLSQWIPNIDANPGKIPSYRTLVIIPTINPDGFAADTRLNADGVDLNRNFPANNWQTEVTEPTAPTVWTDGGGPYPLSEPESKALASYYLANKPRLTMTMHSHGGIVEANDAGDSITLGAQYASLADYQAIPTYAIGDFFDYTTTGAFEDWANDKLGLPVLEVELESATYNEYSRNLPALWAMAQVSP